VPSRVARPLYAREAPGGAAAVSRRGGERGLAAIGAGCIGFVVVVLSCNCSSRKTDRGGDCPSMGNGMGLCFLGIALWWWRW
jgi:hypothetical protein